ncbi:hypothetical protein Bca4012_025000 [Brassica carinata]
MILIFCRMLEKLYRRRCSETEHIYVDTTMRNETWRNVFSFFCSNSGYNKPMFIKKEGNNDSSFFAPLILALTYLMIIKNTYATVD